MQNLVLFIMLLSKSVFALQQTANSPVVVHDRKCAVRRKSAQVPKRLWGFQGLWLVEAGRSYEGPRILSHGAHCFHAK